MIWRLVYTDKVQMLRKKSLIERKKKKIDVENHNSGDHTIIFQMRKVFDLDLLFFSFLFLCCSKQNIVCLQVYDLPTARWVFSMFRLNAFQPVSRKKEPKKKEKKKKIHTHTHTTPPGWHVVHFNHSLKFVC